MDQTYNVTTINVNRIQSATKIAALKDFLYQSDTDIALLQEVLFTNLDIAGYKEILNVAPERACGTAILVKEGIEVTDTCFLDSGRGIRCQILNVTVINVYLPSGNNARQDRANFLKNDIIFLLKDNPANVIIGGDWNCVINRKDQQPNFNVSKELTSLVNNLQWKDVWEIKYPTSVKFTYFSNKARSRIDRIYVSSPLGNKISGVEVIPTTFSNHLAVRCSVGLPKQKTYWGRPLWKLNIAMLHESGLAEQIEESWQTSLRQTHKYRTTIDWWTLCAKKKLRSTLMSYGRDRARWFRDTVEFHYSCLRELYEQPLSEEVRININKVKATLIGLKRRQLEGLKIKSHVHTTVEEENASLFHLIQHEKNRRRTFVEKLRTEDKRILVEQRDILNEIHRYYHLLYSDAHYRPIDARELLENSDTRNTVTEEQNESLRTAISCEDVFDILKNAPVKKSPGPDGLPLEFYLAFWHIIGTKFTDVINETLSGERVPEELKDSVTVLLPKGRNTAVKQLAHMRPICLMNSDYKIIARVMKERLGPVLDKIIGPSQTCLPGRNIFKTVCEYRDIIGIFSTTLARAGIAFIDFSKAFDRVNHEYLFNTMKYMGFHENFIIVLRNMLQGIQTKILINGHYTRSIEIKNGVPQGSPLSMLLYIVALEPLLRRLNNELEGITISGDSRATNAYADDVGVLVRSSEDIARLTALVRQYCNATGAKINDTKSSFLNINGFRNVNLEWAQSVECHTALGVTFYRDPLKTIAFNWSKVSANIRGLLILTRIRHLNLIQKIKIINCAVLSKAIYVGQIFPIPIEISKTIMTTVCKYIWQGEIFRAAVSTITLKPEEGGLGLTDIRRKATALYIKRTLQIIETHPGSVTSSLFSTLQPESLQPPANIHKISYKLKHIRQFYLEISYLGSILEDKQKRTCRYIMDRLKTKEHRNRMEQMYQNQNWKYIWKNIHNKVLLTDAKAAWYKVVNNIVCTNDRLCDIGLSNTNVCQKCHAVDTINHRFVCQGYKNIWDIVRKHIAFLKGSDGSEITINNIILPQNVSSPEQKNNAIVWLLGHYINYVINNKGDDNILEYQQYIYTQYHAEIRKKSHLKNFGSRLKMLFERQGIG